jgi:hypothetical protein
MNIHDIIDNLIRWILDLMDKEIDEDASILLSLD